MPIEIRELVIKATVSDETVNGNTGDERPSGQASVVNDALVKVCVEKVMEIIKQKTER